MDTIFTSLKRGVVGFLVVLSIIFLAFGCTASKYSSQKIIEAENAMEEIEQVEAMNYAQTEFQEAQTKLEDARQLAEKGKHKKAGLKAEETIATAELAEIKTLSQKVDASIKELQVSMESLKERLAQYRENSEDPDEK